MKNRIAFLIISLLLVLTAAGSALAQSMPNEIRKDGTPRYVETRLIPEFASIRPGDTLTIAIIQTIARDWHTYWKNPGDSGESLHVTWKLPDGATAGELQWPAPHRIPIGPLVNFGYSNRNVLLTDISVPPGFKGTSFPVRAEMEWLVCQEICVPETTTISFVLPVIPPHMTPVASGRELFAEARASIPQPVAWPGMVEEQDGALLLSFTPDAETLDTWQSAGKIDFFPDEWGLIANAATQDNRVEDGAIKLKIQRDTRSLQEVGEIQGILAYDAPDGTRQGVIVQTPVPAAPQTVKKLAAEELSANTAATIMPTTPSAPAISLWQALGLALLGGLILNLMPCVFPVLSMKALSLVKMSDREQSHAVVHGLAYTAGILVCFGIIAAILIALQQAGQQIGWGFQLQSPIVVLLLAYLLFLIGLNLSGVFEVGSARMTNIGSRLTQKQGYAGSFFTGMLATIVATPCTAPFMGAAMGYALTQSPSAALGVFMALGLGLALPYLLLAGIPSFRRALPRPGAWMETFRQFLAFPMYASVAWLVWVYGQQVEGAYAILLAGLGIVFIAMGVWIWKKAPAKHPANALIKVVSVMCFGAALAIAALSIMRAPLVASSAVADQPLQHSGDWTPFTQDELDTALKGNDPVFVNMTASWCITCKVNERIALAVDSTQDLFKEKKIVYMIGDWTNQNPEITAYLGTHGRSGVPLYVFYGSRDPTTNTRPDPVVLPQLLTPGLIADVVTYN